MSSVVFSVETASVIDLDLLQRWTCWAPGRGIPCVVGRDESRQAFVQGRLRVIAARQDGQHVGISLVASAEEGPPVAPWRLHDASVIPASECLLWVGMAICPAFRKSGLASVLVRRTLHMAATTGYPFVAAIYPIEDARASTLLVQSGFARVERAGADPEARSRPVYLRSTPQLLDDEAVASVAC
jgi:GNAT superfamily N-acetyltransferase